MAIQDELDSPLARACRALGGQSALARLIGKDQSTIHDRLRDNKPVWAEHVLAIEAATGISRHDLRPDIYPLELTSGAPVSATVGEAIPVGRTPACSSAEIDPRSADTEFHGEDAGSGEAAGSISCDHLDPAADSPPIGKAAA